MASTLHEFKKNAITGKFDGSEFEQPFKHNNSSVSPVQLCSSFMVHKNVALIAVGTVSMASGTKTKVYSKRNREDKLPCALQILIGACCKQACFLNEV